MLEAVLNVPAGQYHFDTQVIDGDEKTILEESAADNKENEDRLIQDELQHQPLTNVQQENNCPPKIVREFFESALSGFDDSSTQQVLITTPDNDENAQVTQAENSSFADHIISLEDAIYGQAAARSFFQPPAPASGEFEEVDDEEGDLTTPKKDPKEKNCVPRKLKRLKRVVKNLNHFPVTGVGDPFQLLGGGHTVGGEGGSEEGTSVSRPVIKDLSLELFRSPDINLRRGSGTFPGGNSHSSQTMR